MSSKRIENEILFAKAEVKKMNEMLISFKNRGVCSKSIETEPYIHPDENK